MSVLIGLGLFAGALALGEFFPALRPYLPSLDALVAELEGESRYSSPSPAASSERPPAQDHAARPIDRQGRGQSAVLALSWTAAFCETAPDRRECEDQEPDRYDATNLALHGLWPEEQFCGGAPYRNVSSDLWQAMQAVMPGTASGLHKHEWEKHGTCYSDTPERYFVDSLRLTLAINKTEVRALLNNNIGKYVPAQDIRAAFDVAFGRGAGDRVLVHCVRDGSRTLIQELRIGLKGDISSAGLAVLLKQARPQKQGCKGGIIDPVGLQ